VSVRPRSQRRTQTEVPRLHNGFKGAFPRREERERERRVRGREFRRAEVHISTVKGKTVNQD